MTIRDDRQRVAGYAQGLAVPLRHSAISPLR